MSKEQNKIETISIFSFEREYLGRSQIYEKDVNEQRKTVFFFRSQKKYVTLQPRNHLAIIDMTPTLQRIQSTPMAPSVGLMEKMSNQDKVAVATFLLARVPNVKVVEEQPVMTNSEIVREKYKNLKRSPRVERLMQLREEAAKYVDLNDERTKHILGLDV